jgi:hypothetical protein
MNKGQKITLHRLLNVRHRLSDVIKRKGYAVKRNETRGEKRSNCCSNEAGTMDAHFPFFGMVQTWNHHPAGLKSWRGF